MVRARDLNFDRLLLFVTKRRKNNAILPCRFLYTATNLQWLGTFFFFYTDSFFFLLTIFNLKFRLLFKECGRPKPSQHRFLDKTRDARRREVWNALHLSSAWAYFSWFSPLFRSESRSFFPPQPSIFKFDLWCFWFSPANVSPLAKKNYLVCDSKLEKKRKRKKKSVLTLLSLSLFGSELFRTWIVFLFPFLFGK